jgi:hypothetical protein
VFHEKPISAANVRIQQAIDCLESWKRHYELTKKDIEDNHTMNRWEFTSTKQIFERPRYMIVVL